MKILYVATVGGFMPFFKDLVRQLIDDGHVVDFAANQSSSKVPDYYSKWGCKIFDISCSRSPLSFDNIKAIKQIRNLAKEYDIVHCHTPLAGMSTRIACRKLRKKQGLKVIYTAHGFHFYKGAPKKNWIIYYPIEKLCSRWTDVLITINKEDYDLAKKKMKAKRIEYVPGVGMDTKKFANTVVDRDKKREDLGIPKDAYLIFSVGELNQNKNHQIVIRAIAELNDSNIHYMIAGVGDQKENLEKLAKELKVNLHLLGYRKDVAELYKAADLFVHPSFREGLPVSVMEAVAAKTTVVCSNIRGCSDLVREGLFDPHITSSVAEVIKQCIGGFNNSDDNYRRLKQFELSLVANKMLDIYKNICGDKNG